ncbi:epoxide hydrolase family protein [Geodermatophilus sabuli]|uniref:Pimeloyl-ACP methyl ester carboxylesterase n=1 Tax=Geodermatophilus sabuli TaxID=1564158 RepID=A0A285EN32_9ACTN|nr:epoxide hydrolase family protein [Geodermatophilus sabuli]MBB3087062.1 pimeloyl-ACP methyl ester carboxylesterase [Geodermatophilus sabuli]SNX99391.1 Pimeloyl-ACP methyl ester carboxylesterase [Geodermatophilus sabuli]
MDDAVTRPFTVDVPDQAVEDLRRRLRDTRWPEPATVDDWSQGVPLGYLRDLCGYWAEEYDWRARQARFNAVPQVVTEIDGLPVHVLHVRSPRRDALPLVLTHGWPGSVAEFLDVLGPLTDPAAYGGDPADAFDVVVPSLPGFGWSGKPSSRGWGLERTADAWAALMTRLGYERFGAQGGDIGSFVSANLGARHPERVVGVHLNMVVTGPPAGRTEFTEREQRALDRERAFRAEGAAYNQQQRTRPQTLGYGLTDSPAGQCAWILEKFAAWSDCDDDPVAVLGADRVLDHVSTYWFTASATSSARMYWEMAQAPSGRTPSVPVPAGVSLFPHEIFQPPREWVQQQFPDLRLWHEHDRGGHFAAMEQPDLLVADVREFFRPLR